MVFEDTDGTLWRCHYRKPATEIQEVETFFGDENVMCNRVKPVLKQTVVYEDVNHANA